MADTVRTDTTAPRAEDVLPVRSRISWGAVLGGAVISLAIFLLLALLGGALGLTLRDETSTQALQTGAAIYAVVCTILALFVGGWVTSQCAAGENRQEAVFHGIIMWGVVMAVFLWMLTLGVSTSMIAMAGMSNLAPALDGGNWQAQAQQAGVPASTIEDWQTAAENPQNREAAMQAAQDASWWTLFGTMLSMAAAALGALAGSGPIIRLLTFPSFSMRMRRETHAAGHP